MNRSWGIYLLSVAIATLVNGCSSPKTDGNSNQLNRLAGCPGPSNCVSSEAQDVRHAVAPFRLAGDSTTGWQSMARIVASLPRSSIVKKTDTYLHAEFRSRVFRFIDDLELLLDPATGNVAIRSASRVGYSDLGVNRRRVKTLRQELMQAKVIK